MESVVREETIAAISTPPGAGGIGIIRISGMMALPIVQKLFVPNEGRCSYASHMLYYGHIREPGSGDVVDEVLTVYMKAPKSYTREDVVEIHCHGSFLVLQRIIELILEQGAVLAEPGEFTKRAFLNGRIDLTRAEAVIDILSARTRKGLEIAQNQLSGELYTRIESIRQTLRELRALVEVAIDFPDEDVDIVDRKTVLTRIKYEVEAPIDSLIRNADQGKIYREGVTLVIAGVPNVGKSSLLNTLLREDRALVTAVPGTTRDSIEEVIDLYGVPVKIIDTAGIRDEAGSVEEMGIRRAWDLIERADLVLFMVDGSRAVNTDDLRLFEDLRHKPLLPVLNKIDLTEEGEKPDLLQFSGVQGWIDISALRQDGIEELRHRIFKRLTTGREQWAEDGCSPNMRHRKALASAAEACDRLQNSLRAGQTLDLLAIDLQDCLDYLAEIIGETTTEDILDVIFEQFCLGK